MTRQIVLDTETTGLEPRQGHRVIELAGVELVNRSLTGQRFHRYLNPDRDIDEGARQVHGISLDFLQDKPRFADIVDDFLDFVADAELVIHNAPFDLAFLAVELERAGRRPSWREGVVDTLVLARERHPGQRNNLDALCKRYGIDNSNRSLHGALLDCELLAAVYLAMTRGQESLLMADAQRSTSRAGVRRASPLALVAAGEDIEQHDRLLDAIQRESGGSCLWLRDA